MAALREADRLRDDVDWSVSHRPPPDTPSSPQMQLPLEALPMPAANEYQPQSPYSEAEERSRSRSGSVVAGSGKRRGSFSFLRRASNSNAATATAYTESSNPPPIPKTLIAQATIDAAQRKGSLEQTKKSSRSGWGRSSNDSARTNNTNSDKPGMLRKSSRLAREKAEQERLAREAAALPKQPPQIPSFNTDIASFDEARPDSVAIFNNNYARSNSAQPPQVPRSTTANFSRPSAAMAPNSSSPPAYAVRSGSGMQHSSSPAVKSSGEYVVDAPEEHHHTTESMTNRGRYSYASSVGQVNVNSPRRVRRRKDPTPFNVLVIGAKNSGKTSFISFLRHSLALPAHKQPSAYDPAPQVGGNRSSFTSHYLESEIEGERVGLTLWDSAGFEKNIVDLQLREMAAFVEAKFEDTFVEEQKVMRSPGVKDTHIHCVFLILDPSRLDSTIAASTSFHKHGSHAGSLDDDLDLQVMRALWGKTTVIPVISKADTLTVGHMSFLKRAVWESLKNAKLDPLEALELEEDDEDDEDASDEAASSETEDNFPVPKPPTTKKTHKRVSSMSLGGTMADENETPYIPMSILSPDPYDLPPYAPRPKPVAKLGRKFAWGFADPLDPEHCDFGRLRDSIFKEWRSELRELSRSKWYENWRTSRLKNLPGQRQRVKGGVTPVGSVPREGRMVSGGNVPRTVSGSTASTGVLGVGVGGEGRSVSAASQVGSVLKG